MKAVLVFYRLLAASIPLLVVSCSPGEQPETLFTSISTAESGIDFVNKLTFDQDFNIYTYRNFYNGGGVALGDINNDGLLDIYLTSNQSGNKLYLNKGNLKFEDITQRAGVAGKQNWSTGVAMADVNGDGWLDIYLCSSGNVEGDPNKQNELFINRGDLTFAEQAREFGIADKGYTTHAAFFDYDKDGDLDVYILNNSYQAIGSFNLRKNERPNRDPLGGHKLMRNDNNHFTDVSEMAGIYGSVISFGLGVTVGDINKDGWQDIYVSNDFFERDYLYINKHDGTFEEELTAEMKSISAASMGADLADVNNDTWPDIFVTDMLPHDNARLKTITTFEDWNRYQYNLENDYYHQFNRNMLQLNNGNGTFSEIGRLAGVEATDWSWGALIFDMDNDGLKDIFIANGIYQDLTNQDFLQYASSEEFVKSMLAGRKIDYKKLVDIIPSNPVPNFAYHNEGDLGFRNLAGQWGLGEPGFSNGSAYGDLDNDGDLDLVTNNVNMPAFLFRNDADKMRTKNNYLKFELKGEGRNTFALGTKITLTAGGRTFYLEQMPTRGFESTVDHRPNFGLGRIDKVDQAVIEWPDGKITTLSAVKVNQVITLHQKDGVEPPEKNSSGKEMTLFEDNSKTTGIDFTHVENEFVDFDRDRLIYHMLSTEGPRMAKGDVNGDSLEDIYIGGAKDQAGALYVQKKDGSFKFTSQKAFITDRASEDMASVFFDADGDGDMDLYVCSGGNEYSSSSTALIDRLYLNDGTGVFKKSDQLLPTSKFESTSTVKYSDYDNDGDLDLFVGVRVQPFLYGARGNGYVLNNDGKGKLTPVPNELVSDLHDIGMITDAAWADIDGDDDADLLIVGEWMSIKVLVNDGGRFRDQTEAWGLAKSNGWWSRIEAADLDNDNDIDFIIANHGLNSRFSASIDKPVSMFVNDFDQNGTVEQIICAYSGEASYPMVLRHDLISQLPSLKKKYLKYESFKDQTITDIFTQDQLKRALKLEVYHLASSALINEGGSFSLRALPKEVQFSCVFGIEIVDFDKDGINDVVLGGNLYRVKPEAGRYDASYGVCLKGKGDGTFLTVPSQKSGILIHGEVRDIQSLRNGDDQLLVVSRNNDSVVTFKLQ